MGIFTQLRPIKQAMEIISSSTTKQERNKYRIEKADPKVGFSKNST